MLLPLAWEATMATSLPNDDMTVAEVLEAWPETVAVFQEFKTACVGCVMAPFDNMNDVAHIYEMDLTRLMDALERAISAAAEQEAGSPADADEVEVRR